MSLSEQDRERLARALCVHPVVCSWAWRKVDALAPVVDKITDAAYQRGRAEADAIRDRHFGNLRWLDGHQRGLRDAALDITESTRVRQDRENGGPA